MRKQVIIIIVTIFFAISLIACSNGKNTQDISGITDSSIEDTHFSEIPSPTEDTQLGEVEEEVVSVISLDLKDITQMSNDKHLFEIIGCKQYETIEGEKFTDTPAYGNVYVVLFLRITNYLEYTDFINPYLVSCKLDNTTEIENTFLKNDPEGRTSIFQNIEPETIQEGFIVWEVPADWKSLDVTFDTWKDSEKESLLLTLTPEGLFSPDAEIKTHE